VGARILAYQQVGRTEQALSVYEEARRVFLEEFGLEPDPQMRKLQARILEAAKPAPAELSAGPGPHRAQALAESCLPPLRLPHPGTGPARPRTELGRAVL
jgi:transcriptional activator